jgi:hypothetical protein
MKQTVDVDDLECPHGSMNHSHTTLSVHADVLPRNLITIPCAGFMTAMIRGSCSPFSSCMARSRTDKLEAAEHHSKIVKRKGGRKE